MSLRPSFFSRAETNQSIEPRGVKSTGPKHLGWHQLMTWSIAESPPNESTRSFWRYDETVSEKFVENDPIGRTKTVGPTSIFRLVDSPRVSRRQTDSSRPSAHSAQQTSRRATFRSFPKNENAPSTDTNV